MDALASGSVVPDANASQDAVFMTVPSILLLIGFIILDFYRCKSVFNLKGVKFTVVVLIKKCMSFLLMNSGCFMYKQTKSPILYRILKEIKIKLKQNRQTKQTNAKQEEQVYKIQIQVQIIIMIND